MMAMLTRRNALSAVLMLTLLPAAAGAVSFTFEGTSNIPVDVRFTADLSISGDILTLVLTNDSLNHINGPSSSLNPNDLLSSFYFDVFNGVSRPTLTYTSAVGNVCLTDSGAADDCSVTTNEADLRAFIAGDNTWQFKTFPVATALSPGTDDLTFGVGTAGNSSLSPNGFNGNIVDGFDYALYAGDATTANINNKLLTTGSITFTWSGATGFTDADISPEGLFGMGTQPDSTGFVPEPGTGLLLGAGLLGLARYGRKK
jgi:hypothetical protein